VSADFRLSLLTDLHSLKAEAAQELAAQRRQAEERAALLEKAQRQATEASHTRSDPEEGVHFAQSGPLNAQKASWQTLIIPQSLRENLKAYCRILRNYEGYRAVGVHLPKGLLFYGPPGCGKTQIAKTLSAEAGLNFVALSTSDCKQMWIGWSADRLAKVFTEAREKQPSLIFIDELDVACPRSAAPITILSEGSSPRSSSKRLTGRQQQLRAECLFSD
jgi:SpoVK/Ycf46/Vps4 family AAA+-type ATPase